MVLCVAESEEKYTLSRAGVQCVAVSFHVIFS